MSSLELHSPLRFYTNLINEIPNLMKLYVVYQFKSPGCNDYYIGKTESNLYTRTDEHASSDTESAIYNHINNFSYYGYIQDLFCFNSDSIKHYNWNILLIKEELSIKQKLSKLNNNLKT